MTSNRGAGFTSTPKGKFDPFNQGRGPLTGTTSSLLAKKSEASPEEVARDMERKVHELLEESAALSHKGDHQAGEPQQDSAGSNCGQLECTASMSHHSVHSAHQANPKCRHTIQQDCGMHTSLSRLAWIVRRLTLPFTQCHWQCRPAIHTASLFSTFQMPHGAAVSQVWTRFLKPRRRNVP